MITDEQVEAALNAYWGKGSGTVKLRASQIAMRAALEAASLPAEAQLATWVCPDTLPCERLTQMAAAHSKAEAQLATALRERDEALEELGKVIMGCPMRPDMRMHPPSQGVRNLRTAFEAAEAQLATMREKIGDACLILTTELAGNAVAGAFAILDAILAVKEPEQ